MKSRCNDKYLGCVYICNFRAEIRDDNFAIFDKIIEISAKCNFRGDFRDEIADDSSQKMQM